jgi:hypothetical protein
MIINYSSTSIKAVNTRSFAYHNIWQYCNNSGILLE